MNKFINFKKIIDELIEEKGILLKRIKYLKDEMLLRS